MARKFKILCTLTLILATLFFYIYSQTRIDVRIEIEEVLNDGYVKFKISNFGKEVMYTGYEPSTPLFDIEAKRNGKWVQVSHHWCGTGLESLTLKKKTALIYEYPNFYSKDEVWRLKLNIYEIKTEPTWMTKALSYLKLKQSGDIVVYSEPVHPQLKDRENSTGPLVSESE